MGVRQEKEKLCIFTQMMAAPLQKQWNLSESLVVPGEEKQVGGGGTTEDQNVKVNYFYTEHSF